ncbi:GTPase IMAP family member 8 isoform X2 [Coregonus clupeaformis]|uniref:GTPase IMAP family member 8 isoform X2 n=1 Tax=Coregonus clupeaformis TaxID=59861 RepID=UPI001BE025BE|nr:GTPase IMAP family member 8 isoform X2 [Coregonus clupeaformis]
MASSICELRAVLLGSNRSGKKFVGNTILGKEALDASRSTAPCEKGEGDVCGRKVNLVDSPGWWKEFHLSDTAALVKYGLQHSVSLCPPGPHAFILVVEVDLPFTDAYRRSVEDHVQLFGERVWSYTIILFTWKDCLGDTTIEQFIEGEGEALQWLIEKCGRRYHVFSNEDRGDGTQVTELLHKIDVMVAGNSGSHFEIETSQFQKVEKDRREMEERAQERFLRAQRQRKMLKALKGNAQIQRKIQILLVGWIWAGKSHVGNTILNDEAFIEESTKDSTRRSGEVAGRQITMVDTPGWWKYFPAQLTPNKVEEEILKGVPLCSPAPHAILLVVPADTSFTEDQKQNIQENMERFGENVWRHTIVLFTYGDWLCGVPIEQHIESEGEALQWLVEKCGNRYHVLNNKNRRDRTQVTDLLEKIEEMVAGNSLFLLTTDTQSNVETAHGTKTNQELYGREIELEELGRIVNQEWDSKNMEMRERVRRVWMAIQSAKSRDSGNNSMDMPMEFKKLPEAPISRDKKQHKEENDKSMKMHGGEIKGLKKDVSSPLQRLSNPSTATLTVPGAVVGIPVSGQVKDKLKDMLEKEWRRREADIMYNIQVRLSLMLMRLRHQSREWLHG